MAETTADVRRDIELTRDRISNTLNQLEQKVHVTQIVKDHPWPAIGLALGAGYLLSGSTVDVKAAATTVAATRGASSKLGTVLDDMVANLMGGLSAAFEQRVEGLVNELKGAIGAPAGGGSGMNTRSNFASPDAGVAAGMSSAGHAASTSSGGYTTGGSGSGAGSPGIGGTSGGASSGTSSGLGGGSSQGSGGYGASAGSTGYQTRAAFGDAASHTAGWHWRGEPIRWWP